MRRLTGLAPMIALALVLSGCGAPSYLATPVPDRGAEAKQAKGSGGSGASQDCGNPLASYPPLPRLPNAGQMPAGSTMATIQQRGRLIVGVSADTLRMGARNPITGRIEGFDIDFAREVARAIFGSPDRIDLKVISSANRIPAVTTGQVDMVVRNMTINCARWKKVAFSTEYYRSGQKVLVTKDSLARTLPDLAGKRVCAPNGTTSMENLLKVKSVTAVGADSDTGCLLLFQQGRVDAITGDDTVLAGLAAQDPYAKVTQAEAFTAEPYGIAISQQRPDFVAFVNAVLDQLRRDGRWTRIYNTWLRDSLGPAPRPPTPQYGRQP